MQVYIVFKTNNVKHDIPAYKKQSMYLVIKTNEINLVLDHA